MFLQVYADGTVIDSEGVHRARPRGDPGRRRALEPGDLYRLKGHCGGPSTDFVEQVQMVVYERSLGRLRANAFSFSGNPQGCDHAVRHLQTGARRPSGQAQPRRTPASARPSRRPPPGAGDRPLRRSARFRLDAPSRSIRRRAVDAPRVERRAYRSVR